MTYTEEQKYLLLDNLFDGVVCLDIYGDIDIEHKNRRLSYYNTKTNKILLNYANIWEFFEEKNRYNYQEIKDLTEGIMIDLTKRKELTTGVTVQNLIE